MQKVQSSNIYEIGWDDGVLKIRFRNKDGGPGALYHYHDVPEHVYTDLMGAESYGKHFLANIRHLYKGIKQ